MRKIPAEQGLLFYTLISICIGLMGTVGMYVYAVNAA